MKSFLRFSMFVSALTAVGVVCVADDETRPTRDQNGSKDQACRDDECLLVLRLLSGGGQEKTLENRRLLNELRALRNVEEIRSWLAQGRPDKALAAWEVLSLSDVPEALKPSLAALESWARLRVAFEGVWPEGTPPDVKRLRLCLDNLKAATNDEALVGRIRRALADKCAAKGYASQARDFCGEEAVFGNPPTDKWDWWKPDSTFKDAADATRARSYQRLHGRQGALLLPRFPGTTASPKYHRFVPGR